MQVSRSASHLLGLQLQLLLLQCLQRLLLLQELVQLQLLGQGLWLLRLLGRRRHARLLQLKIRGIHLLRLDCWRRAALTPPCRRQRLDACGILLRSVRRHYRCRQQAAD